MPIRTALNRLGQVLHRCLPPSPQRYALKRLLLVAPEALPHLMSCVILARQGNDLSEQYDRLVGIDWADQYEGLARDGVLNLHWRAQPRTPFQLIRQLWYLGYPDLAATQACYLQQLGLKDPRHG
jgi:hypothetical protein